MAAKRARRATVAVTTRDIQSSQSEKDLEEMEFELIKRDLELKRLEENQRLKDKTQWLLGQQSTTRTTQEVTQHTVDRRPKETVVRPKKKEEIVNRAQQLEEILYSENCFETKLQKVGKIEENDWNFRVWEKNQLFGEKAEKKVNKVLENSKEILESRKNQIESKLKPERQENSQKRDKKSESKEWIRRMAEELNERMGTKAVLVEKPSPVVSSLPQCRRCGLEVSAVDRISVSGEVLHRSCLRCSKCGISLRLNEFRTELKFLCIYCLKNNSKFSESNDLIKKKENFLKEIQKIDFRERIEFENKETTLDDKCDDSRQNSDIQVISKTALNAQTDDTNDSQSSDDLTFDLTESEDSEIDSSDEWETTSDDSDNNPSDDTHSHNTTVRETTAVAPKETTPQTTTASIVSFL